MSTNQSGHTFFGLFAVRIFCADHLSTRLRFENKQNQMIVIIQYTHKGVIIVSTSSPSADFLPELTLIPAVTWNNLPSSEVSKLNQEKFICVLEYNIKVPLVLPGQYCKGKVDVYKLHLNYMTNTYFKKDTPCVSSP